MKTNQKLSTGHDHLVRRLSENQHGVVAWQQLRDLGVSRSAIRHRIAAGALDPLSPRVLRLVGSPPHPKQNLMAAVLDAGPTAAISHDAAAALWGLPGFWLGSLDVSRQRRAKRGGPMLSELHEPTRLPTTHITSVDGIPVTSVPRTLLDLAGAPGINERRLERAVDNAISLSPPVLPLLHSMVTEMAGRGRRGLAIMRGLLAERPPEYVPPASGLEARVIDLLDDAGIATRRQVDLGGEHWIGRVDLVVLNTRLVVEVDSALHHTSRSDRERDARRDEHLRAASYQVIRVTDEEAFRRPWSVAPRVRQALHEAAAA